MPQLQPVPIKTKGKGFWKGIVMWLLSTRNWELIQDWKYNMNGNEYVIPAGFQFDGASIPKVFKNIFLTSWGFINWRTLVHDYMYKYTACKPSTAKGSLLLVDQKKADQIFRDINIEVNGFYL
jgi:hypothetical protein